MRLFRMLHHWLVPHSGNNHRAKALHHDALFAYVLLLALFNLGVRILHTGMPDVLGFATDIRVEQLLTDTNAKRSTEGLTPLRINTTLSQAAQAKAADMFANNYWAHNSPTGRTPWDFIVGAGYKYALAGENLAKNFDTSDGVVEAWMNSPTHRANIMKPGYEEIGFAVVNGVLNGEETTLVVQMFGTPSQGALAQIPKVEAKAPVTVPEEPAAETETPAPATASAPVVPQLPQAEPLVQGFSFERVVENPKIDITSLNRNVVYVMAGFLIGLLAVDALVASRRRVVRISGNNLAHILFLLTIVVGGLALARGSLL